MIWVLLAVVCVGVALGFGRLLRFRSVPFAEGWVLVNPLGVDGFDLIRCSGNVWRGYDDPRLETTATVFATQEAAQERAAYYERIFAQHGSSFFKVGVERGPHAVARIGAARRRREAEHQEFCRTLEEQRKHLEDRRCRRDS